MRGIGGMTIRVHERLGQFLVGISFICLGIQMMLTTVCSKRLRDRIGEKVLNALARLLRHALQDESDKENSAQQPE